MGTFGIKENSNIIQYMSSNETEYENRIISEEEQEFIDKYPILTESDFCKTADYRVSRSNLYSIDKESSFLSHLNDYYELCDYNEIYDESIFF